MSAAIDLVLVRPKEDGNVGAVARLARNFGAERLLLVAPRAALGPEARRRAMAGLAHLRRARILPDLEAAVKGAGLVVGTSDLVSGRSTAYRRRSVPPERLGTIVQASVGRIALVFGPEDNGLRVDEIDRCDLLVHVPARRDFPTLNLSHAVAVVLYAIHRSRGPADPESTPAPEELLLDGPGEELFLRRLAELLKRTGYPAHKRAGMVLLFRRVLGRSVPSESEIRMLLGLVKSVDRSIGGRRGG